LRPGHERGFVASDSPKSVNQTRSIIAQERIDALLGFSTQTAELA
jgi:hypothetical protein